MALTIRDCCALPCLCMAQVIAGRGGLDKRVDSISVLEWMDLAAFQTHFFLQNEMVITSLYAFREDPDAQLLAVRRLSESGEVGMILYYTGVIVPAVNPLLVRLADELDFPIILMPPKQMNLRYSDVIREVSEQIFKHRNQDADFTRDILERLAGVPEIHRSVSTVLQLLCEQLRVSLLLSDNQYGEYVAAPWPRSLSLPARDILDALMRNEESCQGYRLVGSYPVSNIRWSNARLLAVAPQDQQADDANMAQAVQVLEIALKLWKNYEFDTYSADLIGALINNEASNVTRLVHQRGGGMSYNTLWVLTPLAPADDYKRRSVALANQLKALRQQLEALRLPCHLALLDEYVVVVLALSGGEETPLGQLRDPQLFAVEQRPLRSTADFHQAFRRAAGVMEAAASVYKESGYIGSHEVAYIEDVRRCHKQGEQAVEAALRILAPIRQGREKTADYLIETLGVYFIDCGTDAERTAEQLFLHRNTVKYRLQKAQDLLGFPLERFPEAIALYRALVLLRLLGKN